MESARERRKKRARDAAWVSAGVTSANARGPSATFEARCVDFRSLRALETHLLEEPVGEDHAEHRRRDD